MKFDQDFCATCDMNSTRGSVVPLAMFLNNLNEFDTSIYRFRPFNADLFDENRYDLPNSQVL